MYSWPKIDTYCMLELFVTMRNDVCFVYCQKKKCYNKYPIYYLIIGHHVIL